MQYLILPRSFLSYVAKHGWLPIPEGVDLEALRAVIETTALEEMLAVPAADEPQQRRAA